MALALRFLIGLCLALATTTPATAREWFRATLPGIEIYSNGYPHDLKLWARKIEMYDALLKSQYGTWNSEGQDGAALVIYLLDNAQAVSSLAQRKNLTGFYSSSSEGSFAVASRQPEYYKNRISGQITLFHEYTHHFVYRHFTSAYPAWYREGFAEYTATAAFDMDWRPTVGLPALYRYNQLGKKPLPITLLLDASLEDLKPKDVPRFYAWSWKLVHMLNTRTDRRAQLDRYLALFAQGTPSLTSAAQAFGDLNLLARELEAYTPNSTGIRLPQALAPSDGLPEIEPLDAIQSRLVELHLTRLLKTAPAQTLTALQDLAATYPERADVLKELALAQRDQGLAGDAKGFADAETTIAKALAITPTDTRSVAIWADLAVRRLKREASPNWNNVRSTLAAANANDPNDPFAQMTYFRSYLEEPRAPTAQAHQAIETALKLQPESYQIRSLRIYSLALQNRFDEARAIARVLASDPHAEKMGVEAMASLDRIEAISKREASLPEQFHTAPLESAD